MNVFQLNFDTRLQAWYQLRTKIDNLDTLSKCIEIDSWWQKAPLVNHYLHTQELTQWPNPWELLVDNTYCTVARALGMCYTLLLTGITDIVMVEATDSGCEDLVLVIADGIVLNYWPNTVEANKLQDFTIKRTIITGDTLQTYIEGKA